MATRKTKQVTLTLTPSTFEMLVTLASDLGMVISSGGPMQGKPSISQLFEAVGSGELIIGRNPEFSRIMAQERAAVLARARAALLSNSDRQQCLNAAAALALYLH